MEVENEKGTKLKCLKIDNGLEFLSKEFQELCKSKGIKRHLTMPANPQQSGVIERMNRTILDKLRSMLSDSGMPRKFWGEAAKTTCVLINKSPSSAVEFKMPDNKWYGKASGYDYLRVFGCRTYAHVKQDKLEPRAIKCVLIGYPKGVKGYKLWCTEAGNQRVIISKDICNLQGR